MQGVNSIRLFRKYKKEQQEELQAEKNKIESDRAATQKMLAELLAMKMQLENTKKKSADDSGKSEQSSNGVEKQSEENQ